MGRRDVIELGTNNESSASKYGCVRGQFIFEIMKPISPLSHLRKENSMALAPQVDYLLERDRFMCPPCEYDVRP